MRYKYRYECDRVYLGGNRFDYQIVGLCKLKSYPFLYQCLWCSLLKAIKLPISINLALAVIQQALELLRQKELEAFYQQASEEVDPDWDVTMSDGLTDET